MDKLPTRTSLDLMIAWLAEHKNWWWVEKQTDGITGEPELILRWTYHTPQWGRALRYRADGNYIGIYNGG